MELSPFYLTSADENRYLRVYMALLSQQITTRMFRTGSAPHAKAAAEGGIGRWGWVIIVPLAAVALYGCASDIRWLIAALAVSLLIAPAVALFGYMRTISDRDATAAMFPRKAVFGTDGSVSVVPFPIQTADGTDCGRVPPTMTILPGDINALRFRGKYLELLFDEPERRLLIPLASFESPSDPTILVEAFGRPEVNS